MDITGVNNKPSNLPVNRNSVKAAENDNQEVRMPATEREGDQVNDIARDSAVVSSQAYRLASTEVLQGVTNQTEIPDREKAEEASANLAARIKTGNPQQIMQAVGGNASGGRAAALLAA